ncbi:neutral alpha-glucosidase AB [Halyomorpha halys]|uniref:neutral alpha-glucosidase AB n=1 Tax=Halyomorpha halys TaxID=286706 RepID=UPI0006D4EC03|nr:neutral alpha-glucosidase AB [Halyomorpha halys]
MIFKKQRLVLVCLFVFTFHNGHTVDRSNFKTCEQSSFCRRCRKMEPGKSSYEVDLDTLVISDNHLQVQLVNTEQGNGVRFVLKLTPLKDDTLRLQVKELTPLRERFEAPHVLVGDLETSKRFSLLSKKENSAELQFENYIVEIHAVPFRLDIKHDNQVLISVNSRGLFRFEHTRTKPEERDENEDPGLWEENFKSHHDSKPFGPTAVAMDVSFVGARMAYGLPEHAESFALRTTKKGDPYRFYNLDVFEYELDHFMALYAAIPFLVAHSEEHTTGLFWLNPSETWVDIISDTDNVVSSIVNFVSGNPKPEVQAHVMSESGNIDAFFILGPHPHDVFRQYTVLTGTAPIPPDFSLGYHQSRWNYNDQQDVDNVNKNFDKHDIPMDVMWLDIEHTNGKRYFTWDPIKFPDPIEMQQNLTARGRKLVAIVDPHIKRDPGYFLHNDATNNGYYVKNKDNSDYEGWCWPDASSYLDFLNPEATAYHSTRFRLDKYEGSTEDMFIWNDMNEPSVFNGPEVTMPKDNLHYGGWEHREVHNIWGLLHVKSTFEGLMGRKDVEKPEDIKRPFILSRSAFAGSQRYTAIWTGDNAAQWGHLATSIPMCLSLAIAGMSFCGADVGGFFENPDREMFMRWYQAAIFLPFMRAHSHIFTRRREPWLFDEEVTATVREALRLRYSYTPYWYTTFYQHNKTGAPVIRPLWAEFPEELDTFSIENELLIGNALLSRPVTEAGVKEVSVYFPGANTVWYDIVTYQPYKHGSSNIATPITKIPAFQRSGTIIPRKMRVRRAVSLMKEDPITLIVAIDNQGKASGYLYVDDGTTFRHVYRKDSSMYIHYEFSDNKLKSNLVGDNRYSTQSWIERVVILGLKPGSYKALASADNQEKSLETVYDDSKKALTIRKPGFNIGKQWSIKLT